MAIYRRTCTSSGLKENVLINETRRMSVMTKKRRRRNITVIRTVHLCTLCIWLHCSYVSALLSLATKPFCSIAIGRRNHIHSRPKNKASHMVVDSNNDSVVLTTDSVPAAKGIQTDHDSLLFESLSPSLVDNIDVTKYRPTPSYLSLSLDEMNRLTTFFCDKEAFPSVQPCDYHDMYRLQQALFKRAQQQQRSDQMDVADTKVIREEVAIAATLIQKLLRRALDELILVETTKPDVGSTSRKVVYPINALLPPEIRKKIHASQRHLKLMCTIATFSTVQLEHNLDAAMELLHRFETSVYSLTVISDSAENSIDLDATKYSDDEGHIDSLVKFQILPAHATYKAVIVGWGRQLQNYMATSTKSSPPPKAIRCAEQAQIVLNKMIDRAVSTPNFVLSRNTFNVVLNAWAELGCGTEAHALLSRMNDLSSNVDKSSHRHLSAQLKEIKRTESKTESSQRSQFLSPIRPDLLSYNIVLKAYAKEQAKIRSKSDNLLLSRQHRFDKSSVSNKESTSLPCHKAEKLLKQMEENGNDHSSLRILPDRISYTCVIDALSSSFESDAPFKAEVILNRMEQLYRDTRKEYIRPDTIAYNSVLFAFSKYSEQEDSGYSGKAIDSLGERCEKMLQRMERLYSEGENPDARPDTYSYNSVINIWANTAHVDAARRALNLMDEMERLSLSGDGRVAPNTVSYNTVIKAWGRNSDATAAQLVDDLLNEMEERYQGGDANCKPDTVTYNSVMFAWANSADSRAAEKVESLFNRMSSIYEQNGDASVKPDVTSYNILLNCWVKTRIDGASDLACELLDRMLRLQNNGNTNAINPDSRTYVAVMKCISQSSDPRKAQKALEILDRMETSFQNGNDAAIPNVFAYSVVLNACAFTSGNEMERQEAMDIALEIMSRISKSRTANANHVVYGSFLKSCATLLSMEDARRRPIVETMFKKCCREGQVGEVVLKQLKFAAPPDLYEALVGQYLENGEVRLRSLPFDWRRNVREMKFRHAKHKSKLSS